MAMGGQAVGLTRLLGGGAGSRAWWDRYCVCQSQSLCRLSCPAPLLPAPSWPPAVGVFLSMSVVPERPPSLLVAPSR